MTVSNPDCDPDHDPDADTNICWMQSLFTKQSRIYFSRPFDRFGSNIDILSPQCLQPTGS